MLIVISQGQKVVEEGWDLVHCGDIEIFLDWWVGPFKIVEARFHGKRTIDESDHAQMMITGDYLTRPITNRTAKSDTSRSN